ncbi:hypothetical protein EV421DRAFT_1838499 [Armillaria borealis]|uniref:BTB domain-containing protein n=1 Tax=Armillaria borealis TaxID=47425 RepID=A0AA39J3U2_9AGAR|nr:hypothetical protein EV421DRAFT_1838499 [Armillaria borealis]
MDIDAKSSPTIADAPFNDPTDNVDLVIRTADNVDFFVLGVLLSMRSPSSFFRHALQNNRHTEERDGLPILRVKEDSATFRFILLLCYPYTTPEVESIDQLLAVTDALDKYCLDAALDRLIRTAPTSSLMKEHALRVFAIAITHGWRELGEIAAKHTLAVSLDCAILDVEELDSISARHLFRLQDYHKRCGKAAQLSAYELRYRTSKSPAAMEESFAEMRGFFSAKNDDWLDISYLNPLNAKLLLEPRPDAALDDTIIDGAIFESTRKSGTDRWPKVASSQIRKFGKAVAEEIDRRISEVCSKEIAIHPLTRTLW